MENNDYTEAYECLHTALEDSPNTVDAQDYLLLFKLALKTHYASNETSKKIAYSICTNTPG
jgi:hypothetical protein